MKLLPLIVFIVIIIANFKGNNGKMVSKQSVIVLALLIFFSIPTSAKNLKQVAVYDIQCGCYDNYKNAARLVRRLQELGLSWYSCKADLCIRFIVDVNIGRKGKSSFIAEYPEFADAFLVENLWDLPHPDPEKISPLPSKGEFINTMATYMQKQYQNGYYNSRKLLMSKERARMYVQFIYEASSYYGIDPFLLFAVGNFESYFSNIFGDLDRLKYKHPDPAQGMFQILGSTARAVHQDMKKQKVPYAPQVLAKDLRAYPRTQIYLAAHYLRNLHKQHYGNRYMTLLAYNSNNKPNYDYPRRVMRFYQRACGYFTKWSAQHKEEKTVTAKSPDANCE